MIKVITPGVKATLQDGGRRGHRHMGMPWSGAADRLSFALANFAVGNPWNTPALELALGNSEFQFDTDLMVCVSGAPVALHVDASPRPQWEPFWVRAGERLILGPAYTGCHIYLAISGGFAAQDFMGSGSTYEKASIGGYGGRALRTGDTLLTAGIWMHDGPDTQNGSDTPKYQAEAAGRSQPIPLAYRPHIGRSIVLRVIPGPDGDIYATNERDIFSRKFHAGRATDRMGTRLEGERLCLPEEFSLNSSPILMGTVQLPPSGQPIIMLADGHCTGGYARILQIIRADFWQLGHIAPGTAISFRLCESDEARLIWRRRQAYYQSLMPDFSF